MDMLNLFEGYSTITQYLSSTNGKIKKIVEIAANNVIKAAKQSVQSIEKNRNLVITSYSIHYTKLYDSNSRPARQADADHGRFCYGRFIGHGRAES